MKSTVAMILAAVVLAVASVGYALGWHKKFLAEPVDPLVAFQEQQAHDHDHEHGDDADHHEGETAEEHASHNHEEEGEHAHDDHDEEEPHDHLDLSAQAQPF